MRGLAIAAVVTQAGIAVTGAVVRVTGSGLGCPTWPECFPGSLVPIPHPEIAPLHQWIEFGNRLLTVVVVAVAGLCLLAALRAGRAGRRLIWLAAGAAARRGGPGGDRRHQRARWAGLVDGRVHLLVSMVLVWLAVLLVRAVRRGRRAAAADWSPRAVRRLIATSPRARRRAGRRHPGHRGRPARRRRRHPAAGRRGRAWRSCTPTCCSASSGCWSASGSRWPRGGAGGGVAALPAAGRVVLAQGALGGVQYALGVPEVLVSLHVLGAALVTVAAAALWAATVERPAVPQSGAAPEPSGRRPSAPSRSWHARGGGHRHGGPEVLDAGRAGGPDSRAGELLVEVGGGRGQLHRHLPAQRRLPDELPFVLGIEGAGRVRALGPGVTRVRVGDRVAWANAPGSYARRAVPGRPGGRRCPTRSLTRSRAPRCSRASPPTTSSRHVPGAAGDDVLVHAAAGGMGCCSPRWPPRSGPASSPPVHRGEGGAGPRGRRGRGDPVHRGRRRRRRGARAHRRRRGGGASTTASGGTRSTPAWPACADAGCWCSTAPPAGRCRRSTRSG